MKNLYLLLTAFCLLFTAPTQAHNLRLRADPFSPDGTMIGTAGVPFYLTWDGSWRDSVNWDAAWVFGKCRPIGPGGTWQPMTFSAVDADHLVSPAPTPVAFNAAADGRGVFMYRETPGEGSFGASGALRWNYAADGITRAALALYEIRLYAVEMVHIPQGGFQLNATDLPALANEFTSVQGSLTQISSENPLPVGAIRWVNDTGGGGTGNEVMNGATTYPGSAALGATYPKGYAAMYCMKYELSQGQYTDFLNALPRTQQIRRVPVDISGDSPAANMEYVMAETDDPAATFRSTIVCPRNGMGTTEPVVFSCNRPDRAANFLIWADGAAYLDWAGLRPLSELEYEKVCRGPLPAVPGELAGGAAPVAAVNINGPENGTETTDAGANYVFGFQNFIGGDAGNGPLRCGIFATATSTRAQAGAAYYGVMEMSGNVWERCITVAEQDAGQPTNAGLFDGNRNGDGTLDSLGNHDVPTWPNSTDVLGSNYRGGNWSRPAEWAAVSDRQYGGTAIPGRTSHRGIRGGRSGATLSSPPQGTGGTTLSATKYHGGGYDGYATTASAMILVIGLPENLVTGHLDVFPNPAAGAVTFRLSPDAPALENATLTLLDALGRPVRRLAHLNGHTVALSVEHLTAGVYSFRLVGPKGPVAGGRLVVK